MQFRILSLAAAILALLHLTACSKKEEKPARPPASKPAAAGFASISEVPEDTRKRAEVFGRQLESDLNAHRTQAVQAAFSPAAIVDAICEGVRASDKQLDEFKSGVRRGILTSVKFFSIAWMDQQPKFKGLVLYKGTPAIRFRFTSDKAGITLIDMAIRDNPQGKPVIVDFYNQALGFDMVEQGRQTATPILAEMDKTFLDRLLGKPEVTDAELRRFGELARKFRDGDSRGAISVYKSLPEILRTNLAATAIYLIAVQRTGDDEAYKKALKDAAARFKTANFQFMLVDLYFLDKEYDKAIECLDNFVKGVGDDAALLTLKSLLLYSKHDIPAARAILKQALQLEPDFIYAHRKGLDVLLAAKDFAAVRDSMVFLEQNADYNFKGALKDPLWDEFKKAPESERWR